MRVSAVIAVTTRYAMPRLTGNDRLKLIIDPGPRSISGAAVGPVAMDKDSVPAGYQGAHFPEDMLYPNQDYITTLGELRTDGEGRLLVLEWARNIWHP